VSDLGELFDDYKKERSDKKMCNAIGSEEILNNNGVVYKRYTDFHFMVDEYNFYPSTGLYIHKKTNRRGRGIFNLLKAIKK
jgi:hypothetical protein